DAGDMMHDDTDRTTGLSTFGERGAPLCFRQVFGEGREAGGAFFDALGECFSAGVGGFFVELFRTLVCVDLVSRGIHSCGPSFCSIPARAIATCAIIVHPPTCLRLD